MPITIDNLLPGDCLIEKGSGLFGWAARTFIHSDYQHVMAVTWTPGIGLESTWSGVQRVALPKNLDGYAVRRPKCDREVTLVALAHMHKPLRQPYGYLSVALMWLRRATGWTWLPDAPGYFCSELYCHGFSQAGFDVVPVRADCDSTPLDLYLTDRLETL